jgi:hypothetical protein
MSFSLKEWKGNVESNFLRANSYIMTVNPPNGFGNEIRLRTETVTLPGVNFLTADGYRPYGNGKTYDIPYSYNAGEITCTHLVDRNADIYQTFFEWATYISDIKGFEKFAPRYFDQYARDAQIEIYGRDFTNKVKTIKLFGLYPKTIDQMQMSWADSEIARLSVSYYFTNFQMT